MAAQNFENAPAYRAYDDFDRLYHEMEKNPRTPVTTAFFALANLNFIESELNRRLSEEFGFLVKIESTSQYYSYLVQMLQATKFTPNVQQVINHLDREVIEHEMKIHYWTIKRRMLYLKWFVKKDRPRVIAPPRSSHGRHRMDSDIKPGRWNLGDPDGRRYDQFLAYRKCFDCVDMHEPTMFKEMNDF